MGVAIEYGKLGGWSPQLSIYYSHGGGVELPQQEFVSVIAVCIQYTRHVGGVYFMSAKYTPTQDLRLDASKR